jgi:hypothetical protein
MLYEGMEANLIVFLTLALDGIELSFSWFNQSPYSPLDRGLGEPQSQLCQNGD